MVLTLSILLAVFNTVAIYQGLPYELVFTYNFGLICMAWWMGLEFGNQVKLCSNYLVVVNVLRVWKPQQVISHHQIKKLVVKTESTYGNLNLLVYTNAQARTRLTSKPYTTYRLLLPKPKPFVRHLGSIHAELTWKHNGKNVPQKKVN